MTSVCLARKPRCTQNQQTLNIPFHSQTYVHSGDTLQKSVEEKKFPSMLVFNIWSEATVAKS